MVAVLVVVVLVVLVVVVEVMVVVVVVVIVMVIVAWWSELWVDVMKMVVIMVEVEVEVMVGLRRGGGISGSGTTIYLELCLVPLQLPVLDIAPTSTAATIAVTNLSSKVISIKSAPSYVLSFNQPAKYSVLH